MGLNIRFARALDQPFVLEVLKREWHGPLIERGDEFVDASALPALAAELDGELVGLATLLIGDDFVEIITINSFKEGSGIGSALIEATIQEARKRGATDVRLYTTNDNLQALGFYQKRGFVIWALHRDTMTRARVHKPEIPFIGRNGIPIRDEIELRIAI